MRIGEGFFTTLTCLGLSLILNGAAVVSLGPGFSTATHENAKENALRKGDAIRFEYVESPVKTYRLPPRSSGKISDKNALDQDQARKKNASGAPAVTSLGPANQLRQSRKSSPAARSQSAQPAKPKTEKNEASPTPDPGTGETGIPVRVQTQSAVSKPQEPRRAEQGKAGAVPDKIEIQEMAKTEAGGAALFGVTSFEATGSGMGEYMKRLKEKVWGAWFPYIAFKYPQEFIGSDSVLIITLDAKGEVKRLRVIESTGSEAFTTFCMQAIQRASGFGDLPAEVLALTGKDQIDLRFAFHYR